MILNDTSKRQGFNMLNLTGVGTKLPVDQNPQIIATPAGKFHNETVKLVPSPSSLIQDAAEELSFAVAEKKSLGLKGKIRDKKALKTEQSGAIREYLEKVPDVEDKESLGSLRKKFLEEQPHTGQQLKKFIAQHYEDPTHQFIALQFLHKEMAKANATDAVESIALCRQQLLEENSVSIQSGLNVSLDAAKTAQETSKTIQSLRDHYRETVLSPSPLYETYNKILEEFRTQEFAQAVSFLLKAASSDLQAETPSTDTTLIQLAMQDIAQLQSLVTTHELCASALEKASHIYTLPPQSDATRMMKGVLPMTSGFVGEEAVEQVSFILAGFDDALSLNEKQMSCHLFLLHRLNEVVSSMPMKLFETPEAFEGVKSAVQEAIDVAIEQEENM